VPVVLFVVGTRSVGEVRLPSPTVVTVVDDAAGDDRLVVGVVPVVTVTRVLGVVARVVEVALETVVGELALLGTVVVAWTVVVVAGLVVVVATVVVVVATVVVVVEVVVGACVVLTGANWNACPHGVCCAIAGVTSPAAKLACSLLVSAG
jgi:hypothetical protein